MRYDIAFLKGDKAGMEREVALGQAKSGAEDWISHQRGVCAGIFRSLATGKEHVTACGGLGSAGGPAGKGGYIRSRSSSVGGVFRECGRGKAKRDGSTRAFQGPGCGVWRCLCAGPLRGFFAVASTRERSGKALPGGYVRQIQLPAGASRASRTEPRRAFKGHRTATNRRSL